MASDTALIPEGCELYEFHSRIRDFLLISYRDTFKYAW